MNFLFYYLALTYLLFVSNVASYSQKADSSQCKRIIIKTSLSEYLHSPFLNTANFNIGIEKQLKNRNSIYGNFGIIQSFGTPKGWLTLSSLSTKGFKIQIEKRHYISKHKIFEPAILIFWPHIFQYHSQKLENSGYYYSFHYSYQFTKTQREESLSSYPTISKTNIYSVNRNVYRLNFKFGYQCIKGCGLSIDQAIGIGAQFIMSSSQNRHVPNFDEDFPCNKYFDEGSGLCPSLVYQFALGWGFR